ncbi:MAG: LysR family transcriptional regulator [Verrucomicrobia bacterium]|nr:LysR family transcriptional regulator [Verrucomicrobiota bacterium]
MDYRLQVFAEVASQQTISGAAKMLGISQPAVTQHIHLLEEHFKVPLFTRSRHGVALTEEGLTLLAHARQVATLEEKIAEKLHQPHHPFHGRLRLGTSNTITQYYLPKILARFKKNHPAVTIEVLGGNSTSTIGSLLDQRIDIGLIEGPCRRRDLRVHPFFEDEIVPIASPKNPLSKKKSITPHELSRALFIFREQGSGTRQHVEEHLQRAKISIKQLQIIQELPSTEAIKRVIALDMGLGFVSRLSITNEIANGTLSTLNIPRLKIRRHFSTILALGPDPMGLRQIFLKHLS